MDGIDDTVPNFGVQWSDLDHIAQIEGEIFDDDLNDALLQLMQDPDPPTHVEHSLITESTTITDSTSPQDQIDTSTNTAVEQMTSQNSTNNENEVMNTDNESNQGHAASSEASGASTNPQFDNAFMEMDESEMQNFIDGQQNKNTVKKTLCDIALVRRFLKLKKEEREIHEIPPNELDVLLANFLLTVRKKDGGEYEPTTLRSIVGSVDRKLRRHKYGHTIISDNDTFNLTKNALKAKQKILKQKGKGNKSKRSQPLTDEEINLLYERNLLGDSSPEALLNTVWLQNSVHFGLRGVGEHYTLRWGDVTCNTSSDGTRYLELNERQTKTRTGENIDNVREISPKMYECEGNRNPLSIYDTYALKRPKIMNAPDAPFYVAPRTIPLNDVRSDKWFISQKVGERKLASIVKKMKEKGGLDENKRLTNHSARKYLVQKLRKNDVQNTDIMQISGHKSVTSVNNYSSMSENKQKQISNILSNTDGQTAVVQRAPVRPVCAAPTPNDMNITLPGLSAPPTSGDIPNFCSQTNMSSRITSMFYGATLNVQNLNVYMAANQP